MNNYLEVDVKDVKRYDLTCGDGGMYQDEAPDGEWVTFDDAVAETLRADTAEAELLSQYAKRAEIAEKLAANEQRVSELEKILRTAKTYIRDLSESLGNACEDFEGDEDEDPQAIEECDAAREFIDRIDTALNPKPEAGSHED